MKRKIAVALLVLAAGGAGAWLCLSSKKIAPRSLPPVRPSAEFKETVMVPTLDRPIPEGKSAVWCAAFQLAWNRLKADLAREPVRLAKAEPLSAELNGSPLLEGDLVEGSYYAAAGFARDGIQDRIRREMAHRFPGVEPDLAGGEPAMGMAYAYLATRLRFAVAYPDLNGMGFASGRGTSSRVKGFGFGTGVTHDLPLLAKQPRVLFVDDAEPPREFAVDLDHASAPHQVVLACMKRPATLAEGVGRAEEWLRREPQPIRGGETLQVPEVQLGMLHRFGELEGTDHAMLNSALQGLYLGLAQQKVQFRLDRNGAELRAEAQVKAAAAAPRRIPSALHFDRPFLLLMKKRGAARPYLAVWVDNAEILEPWQPPAPKHP